MILVTARDGKVVADNPDDQVELDAYFKGYRERMDQWICDHVMGSNE